MEFYETLLGALRVEDRVMLATVIGAAGSTPVPPGAHMLLYGGGRIPAGTVGGGCVEAAVQEEARRQYASGGKSSIHAFCLEEDDLESGMLCGGRIDVLVEAVEGGHRALYERLVEAGAQGEDMVLFTALPRAGNNPLKLLAPADGPDTDVLRELEGAVGGLPASLGPTVAEALRKERVARVSGERGELVVEPVIAPRSVIIFGGGHVSRFVSRGSAMAGFRVTVVDDRPEYANPDRFPEAARTVAGPFPRSWDLLRVTPTTSIVIVTRGHKFDEEVLKHAVTTPAGYIGMIGSRAKVAAAFRRLRGRGVPEERLAAIRAPIGFDIGAVTAEEIGVSITAELIAVRRGRHGAAAPMAERR